jgi:hypothetical protein
MKHKNAKKRFFGGKTKWFTSPALADLLSNFIRGFYCFLSNGILKDIDSELLWMLFLIGEISVLHSFLNGLALPLAFLFDSLWRFLDLQDNIVWDGSVLILAPILRRLASS